MHPTPPIVLAFLATVLPTGESYSHSPVDFLEASSVTPVNPIEHGVELQSVLDDAKIKTLLTGPERFAEAVGCFGRPVKETRAYLNWYRIVEPTQEPQRSVSVLDMVRDNDNRTLTIGSAAFLLTPAQRLSSGPPDSVPDGLDQYKAYQVIDAASVKMLVEMTGSTQANKRLLARPILVCVPVQQWHHDEYFKVSHPRDCFVVYELDSQPNEHKVSTIDQFGLNELVKKKSDWLCVRAALLSPLPK